MNRIRAGLQFTLAKAYAAPSLQVDSEIVDRYGFSVFQIDERVEDGDDSQADIYPNAEETCRDEVDLNCDGEVNFIPLPTTCEVHLVEQSVLSSLDLTGTGLIVGSVAIHGSAVKGGSGATIEAFLAYSETEVETTFRNYMQNHGPFEKDEIIIIDIESPVHPKKFYEYLDDLDTLEALVEAFKMRIKVVKSVVPTHPVALYGIVVPHGQGSEEGFSGAYEGYQKAGELGLYDDLDYLVPVLYHRWGASDNSAETRQYDLVHQALSKAAALTNSAGQSVPLFPLLSLSVFNPNSLHDRQAPLAAEVDAVVEMVLEYPEVDLFGFWTGDDESAPVGDIPTFFEQVTTIPIADCECPED